MEKWVTSGKWVTQLNSSEWLTLGKGVTIKKKNESHLEKWVTLKEMGHTCENAHTWRNESHLVKWVKFGKVAQF